MAEVAVEIMTESGSPTTEEVETREIIEQIVNNEAPVEVVKMKKPRAKPKTAITKEDIMEAVKEATKKPVPDKIDKNKEMVECPDCGLSITQHNLKYTHKRYCKALKEKEKQEEAVAPPPGLLVREKKTST
eukprot:14841644-Heterocapsa_arctica.AAC.1